MVLPLCLKLLKLVQFGTCRVTCVLVNFVGCFNLCTCSLCMESEIDDIEAFSYIFVQSV